MHSRKSTFQSVALSLLIVAIPFILPDEVNAQQSSQSKSQAVAPLTGKVDMNVNSSSNRLNRKAIMGEPDSDLVDPASFSSPVQPNTEVDETQSGSVSQMDDSFPDLQSQQGRRQRGGRRNRVANPRPRPQAKPPVEIKRPHKWMMSRDGGYYDETRQIEGTVPGAELYKYGGFMSDGVTPVPTGPVRTNQWGHIDWHPSWMKNK